ncbi:hypothetical protein [Methanothrix sp.]|uniref:hypothetical protein n=1 Tax=Methanothrix sp. TaxID=90426 RepID=UPI0025F417AE|nr:hypothetical protein [Methanothrix sp.]
MQRPLDNRILRADFELLPADQGIFRFNQKGLALESEMLADAAAAGLRIQEVEIGVRYDVNGSSENPVAHGVRVLVNVLRTCS